MKLTLEGLNAFRDGEIVIRCENPPFTLTGRIQCILLGVTDFSVRCSLRRVSAQGALCANETIQRWVLSSMDPDYTIKLDEFSLVEPQTPGWLSFSRDLPEGVTMREEVVTLIPRKGGSPVVEEEVEVT